jgi:calmodulin
MHSLDQNPSDADIAKMIKAVDADGNGCIDFAEFLSMMANIGVDDGGQLLVDEFRVFDKNGDGLINVMELKYVMSRLGLFRV